MWARAAGIAPGCIEALADMFDDNGARALVEQLEAHARRDDAGLSR